MPLDFTEITDGESFELFCSALLRALGFAVESPPSRGPDGGVDMIIRSPIDPNLGLSSIFLIQCKHLAHSGKAVGLDDLHGISLQDLALRYAAQGYILITSTLASQAVQNHFTALRQRTGLLFTVWDCDFIESRLAATNDANIANRYFPRSGQLLRDSLLLPPSLPSWDTLLNTLHARALTDISQTIGQKYIPDLYVARTAVEPKFRDFAAASTKNGHLLINFHALEGAFADALRNANDINQRLAASKISSLNSPQKATGFWRSEEHFESQRDSYRQLIAPQEQFYVRLERVSHILSEVLVTVTPAKNVYAYTRSKVVQFIYMLAHEAKNLSEYFMCIRAEVGKIANAINESKNELREIAKIKQEDRDIGSSSLIKQLSSFFDSISGACEESLSAIDFIMAKISEPLKACATLEMDLRPGIALIERAGRGKTNLVCDLVTKMGRTFPVFFIAAKSLPLTSEDPIKKYILDRLQVFPGFRRHDFLSILAQLAHLNDSAVIIIMDGINENVDPFSFANKLQIFLSEIDYTPLRVAITCREEYWSVFKSVDLHMATTLHDTLGFFTRKERDLAIKKYFSHYRITTLLEAEPLHALQDPLLLRFFCEAYGNRSDAVGPRVKHIRLKLLFDEYKYTKYAQIAEHSKEYRSSDGVADYVDRIARALLKSRTTSLEKRDLAETIPKNDLNSVGSLYSRLLDEDIVIEQRYVPELGTVVVNFTYEAFMEYVIGGMVASDRLRENCSIVLFLTQWLETNSKFPNIAGIIGFLLPFLFENSREEFIEAAIWLNQTAEETYLYALRIGFDNLEAEEFDHRMIGLLLRRLATSIDLVEAKYKSKTGSLMGVRGSMQEQLTSGEKENAFAPEEARRILFRCPPSLSSAFRSAFQLCGIDTGRDPVLWASVFEHFGQDAPDLMWEAIRLRFSTSPPLRLLSVGQIQRMSRWCREHPDALSTGHALPVVRTLIKGWKALLPRIKEGSYGGWEGRAEAIDAFVKLLNSAYLERQA
jgi:hypothetical protein